MKFLEMQIRLRGIKICYEDFEAGLIGSGFLKCYDIYLAIEGGGLPRLMP